MFINPNDLKLHQLNYRQNRSFICDTFKANLKAHGQFNPVKVIEHKSVYYVVDGWRRVMACQALEKQVWIEVISDDINPVLSHYISETKRSDYEQFCILQYLVEKTKVSYSSLANRLNLSKDRLYNLFSFKDLDTRLINAINDFRSVTSSTAKEMRSIQKSKEGLKILIELADEIRSGLGASKLRLEVAKRREKNERNQSIEIVVDENKKPIGVYRGKRQFTFDDGIVERYSKDVLQKAISHMINSLNQGTFSIRQ